MTKTTRILFLKHLMKSKELKMKSSLFHQPKSMNLQKKNLAVEMRNLEVALKMKVQTFSFQKKRPRNYISILWETSTLFKTWKIISVESLLYWECMRSLFLPKIKLQTESIKNFFRKFKNIYTKDCLILKRNAVSWQLWSSKSSLQGAMILLWALHISCQLSKRDWMQMILKVLIIFRRKWNPVQFKNHNKSLIQLKNQNKSDWSLLKLWQSLFQVQFLTAWDHMLMQFPTFVEHFVWILMEKLSLKEQEQLLNLEELVVTNSFIFVNLWGEVCSLLLSINIQL